MGYFFTNPNILRLGINPCLDSKTWVYLEKGVVAISVKPHKSLSKFFYFDKDNPTKLFNYITAGYFGQTMPPISVERVPL
jgi:hypothetical protein